MTVNACGGGVTGRTRRDWADPGGASVSVLVTAVDMAGEEAAEARGRRVRVVKVSMGDRSTRGADRWKSRSTRGAERWRSTRGADRWKSRNTRGVEKWRQEHAGCRQVGEKQKHTRWEQKHTRMPNRSTECRTDSWRGCRDKMSRAEQATEGRTDYIHGQCARQDPWAHTRGCHSGLTPGAHTQPAYHAAIWTSASRDITREFSAPATTRTLTLRVTRVRAVTQGSRTQRSACASFCSYGVEATVKEKSSAYGRREDIPSGGLHR